MAAILHDLGATVPKRLRDQIRQERTTERRVDTLSRLVAKIVSAVVPSVERPTIEAYVSMYVKEVNLPPKHYRRCRGADRVPPLPRPLYERLT